MNKFTILTFSLIAILSISPSIVAAASTATPSGTPSPTISDDSVRDNLEQRIKNIVKENLSTTEAKLQEKIQQSSLVGLTGTISNITSTTLTLKSSTEIIQVKITDKTTFANNTQPIKATSLAISDKVILIGTPTSKPDIIDAKRIVVVKDTILETPSVYFGTITTVNIKQRIVSINYNGSQKDFILSKRANLKITDFVVGKNTVIITQSQDAGLVITTAKVY